MTAAWLGTVATAQGWPMSLLTRYQRLIMADDEVATKAPQSDSHESVQADDTPAQKGPSMGVGQEPASVA